MKRTNVLITMLLAALLLIVSACEVDSNGDDTAAVPDTDDVELMEDDDQADDAAEAEPTPTLEPEPTPTAEPEPTLTPEPEPTATPEPQPEGPTTSFSDGTYRVGDDIEPGVYFANEPGSNCYWERLSGFGGTIDEIIVNEFTDSRQIVEIADDDAEFSTTGCGAWEQDPEPVRENNEEAFGDGVYLVGDEIAPGTWRSEGGGDSCYWARLSDLSRATVGIVTNSFGGTGDIVQIAPEDAAFESTRCGSWVRIGD